MSVLLFRLAAPALIAIMFAVMARGAPARSSRQSAFGLAAAAFVCFALSNGLTFGGVSPTVVQILSFIGVAMLGVSLLMMVRSYTSGEMSDKLQRAREMIAEERARTKERPER